MKKGLILRSALKGFLNQRLMSKESEETTEIRINAFWQVLSQRQWLVWSRR